MSKVSKFLLTLTAIVLGAAVAGGVFLWRERVFARTPFGSAEEKVVEVPPGAGPRAIAELLADGGVVEDGLRFYRYVRFGRRAAGQMKAGEYAFVGPLTPEQVLDKIVRGEVRTYRVTVPEGLRLDEIAPLFEQAGIARADEFLRAARDPKTARALGVAAASLEGYVFPDTYFFPRGLKAEPVLRRTVERFRAAWEQARGKQRAEVTLTQHEAVTLASIVEKETGAPEERPRIACVFHNRLKKRMPLQTDPTVIYAVILRDGSFSGNLHRSDLESPHPYNTYRNRGLPPGPIANPGELALEAALAPADCRDLYFVSRNDGTHVFCPDLKCHEKNVQIWQRDYFRAKRRLHKAKGG